MIPFVASLLNLMHLIPLFYKAWVDGSNSPIRKLQHWHAATHFPPSLFHTNYLSSHLHTPTLLCSNSYLKRWVIAEIDFFNTQNVTFRCTWMIWALLCLSLLCRIVLLFVLQVCTGTSFLGFFNTTSPTSPSLFSDAHYKTFLFINLLVETVAKDKLCMNI